jgi:hypothetical protein
MSDEIMSEIVSESDDGLEQIRLTVNEFRGIQYLHVRKYYLDFDETYQPTDKGVAMPITMQNIANMFNALVKLLARSDVLHIILEHSDETTQGLIYETLSRQSKEEGQ